MNEYSIEHPFKSRRKANDMEEKKHTHDHCMHAAANNVSEEMLCDLADLFKIFGDTTRLRILFALLDDEMCVMHISERLGMTSSAISHQLRVLKDNNLVACRREGKTMFYYLADDHVHTIVAQGYDHLREKHAEESK